jgi:hypothetical protein
MQETSGDEGGCLVTAEAKAFEGWAIVELMGHVRLAGYVTEVELAGAGFLRLEIAEHNDGHVVWPAATQFCAPGSVYRITPCTEEAARLVRSHAEPVTRWEIPKAALAAGPPEGIEDIDAADVDEHEDSTPFDYEPIDDEEDSPF